MKGVEDWVSYGPMSGTNDEEQMEEVETYEYLRKSRRRESKSGTVGNI